MVGGHGPVPMEGGRRGWECRVVGSRVCQAESLALVLCSQIHHPDCFIPVSPTHLLPASQVILCHLNSHSPKTLLCAYLTCFLHLGNFSLCLLKNFISSFKIQLKCHPLRAAFSDCHGRHELPLPLESHTGEPVLLFTTH